MDTRIFLIQVPGTNWGTSRLCSCFYTSEGQSIPVIQDTFDQSAQNSQTKKKEHRDKLAGGQRRQGKTKGQQLKGKIVS